MGEKKTPTKPNKKTNQTKKSPKRENKNNKRSLDYEVLNVVCVINLERVN